MDANINMNDWMNKCTLWVKDIPSDENQWRSLLSVVLHLLTTQLATTKQKATFIDPQDVMRLMDSFSEYELNEWKHGVQKGLKVGDWSYLVNHRACQSNS